MTLAEKIDALLPQTQCTQCGFDGCFPYAESIARGESEINRCPPGGEAGVMALAQLLSKPVLPLDESCGVHRPHRVARIDEAVCIGCAKCLPACPTDAIIGANKFMHTVVAALCTGCDRCLPPCPVDCITIVEDADHPVMMDKNTARARFRFHQFRLERDQRERAALLAERERSVLGASHG
jgi:electron transport complex protein RnfB